MNTSPWGKSAFLVTSSLSIARDLWRYGEPELVQRALKLDTDEVVDVGIAAMQLLENGRLNQVWPNPPKNGALAVAAIERFEGKSRPPRRRTRAPGARTSSRIAGVRPRSLECRHARGRYHPCQSVQPTTTRHSPALTEGGSHDAGAQSRRGHDGSPALRD